MAQAVQEKTENILAHKTEKKNIIDDENLGNLFGINIDAEINFAPVQKSKKNSPRKSTKKPVQTNPKIDLILAIIEEYGEDISVKDLVEISGQSAATIYPMLAHLKKTTIGA